jgi:hypothetical protein
VKQQVNGMSVDALLPNPTKPKLVKRIDPASKPASLDRRIDPSQKTASATSKAQRAGAMRAAVSSSWMKDRKGIVAQ